MGGREGRQLPIGASLLERLGRRRVAVKCTYPNGKVVNRTYTPRDQVDQIDYDSAMVVDLAYDAGKREIQQVGYIKRSGPTGKCAVTWGESRRSESVVGYARRLANPSYSLPGLPEEEIGRC
jgi:hypothetical protein